jgi:hypothetical protein
MGISGKVFPLGSLFGPFWASAHDFGHFWRFLGFLVIFREILESLSGYQDCPVTLWIRILPAERF